jgi:hypothetical protein
MNTPLSLFSIVVTSAAVATFGIMHSPFSGLITFGLIVFLSILHLPLEPLPVTLFFANMVLLCILICAVRIDKSRLVIPTILASIVFILALLWLSLGFRHGIHVQGLGYVLSALSVLIFAGSLHYACYRKLAARSRHGRPLPLAIQLWSAGIYCTAVWALFPWYGELL